MNYFSFGDFANTTLSETLGFLKSGLDYLFSITGNERLVVCNTHYLYSSLSESVGVMKNCWPCGRFGETEKNFVYIYQPEDAVA
jgi:hypothetical protein